MVAGVRIIDPERGVELMSTKNPTFMLSGVSTVNFSKKEGSIWVANELFGKQAGMKGVHSPLIVLPLYHVREGFHPFVFETALSDDFILGKTDSNYVVKLLSHTNHRRTDILCFDIPEMAIDISEDINIPRITVYNPENGQVTFDSRNLPLNVVGFIESGMQLDPNRIYGWADLSEGVGIEWSVLSSYHHNPYTQLGYMIVDGRVVSIEDGSEGFSQRPIPNPRNSPYIKFYNWYNPHILVDLTEVYNYIDMGDGLFTTPIQFP